MKLSEYAKQMGVRYETAWRWFRDGKIQGQRIGLHNGGPSAFRSHETGTGSHFCSRLFGHSLFLYGAAVWATTRQTETILHSLEAEESEGSDATGRTTSD